MEITFLILVINQYYTVTHFLHPDVAWLHLATYIFVYKYKCFIIEDKAAVELGGLAMAMAPLNCNTDQQECIRVACIGLNYIKISWLRLKCSGQKKSIFKCIIWL